MANTFKELEDALKHNIISMYYSESNNGSLNARKKVSSAIINGLANMGEGLGREDLIELMNHVNGEITKLYSTWRDNLDG